VLDAGLVEHALTRAYRQPKPVPQNDGGHHQHLTVANKPQQRVHRRAARLVGQTQRTGHRDGHDRRTGDRGQIDVPHTVTELGRDTSRDLNGETGLAGAARAGQGHQPVIDQKLAHVGYLGSTSDEARELHRKILSGNGIRRA
jgi:hypothetical protein